MLTHHTSVGPLFCFLLYWIWPLFPILLCVINVCLFTSIGSNWYCALVYFILFLSLSVCRPFTFILIIRLFTCCSLSATCLDCLWNVLNCSLACLLMIFRVFYKVNVSGRIFISSWISIWNQRQTKTIQLFTSNFWIEYWFTQTKRKIK